MCMTKLNAGDDLLHDLQKILLGALPDFSGGDRGGRMGDEDGAEPLLEFRLSDDSLNLVRQVHDLFQLSSADP